MAIDSKTTDWLTTRSSLPKSYAFTVNGKPVTIPSDSHYPLLWALRDNLNSAGAAEGEFRNWDAITAWVDGIATSVRKTA